MFASLMSYATRPFEPRVTYQPRHRVPTLDDAALTIRLAPSREAGIERLAELDGRTLGAGPSLVAEVDGRPIAAVALVDASAVADPMRPSAPFVELLRVRARQLASA